ncbi:MAG TPA: septum formation initiator family protein [Burkholderiaceae bacterium]|jgi:cell division protein FtsB|nr:septum formation initiator family protein [Rhodoferax sp.]HNW00857.1 septum formation initiator family protein [Burkholderiaceae bacterium]MBK7547898.1 septum formation initiator family protein [Rhodoferax sp.]MBP6493900.1 septum formation initiator family protein [Rhodoferax sp.]MBP7574870.1 septum formation initiator family protein [Rhodoferax sp.]
MTNRLAPAALVALLVILHSQLWLGRGSVPGVANMTDELNTKKQANLAAQLANERLASEVRDLKEGLEMVEEKARLELGMVKANEIYVQMAK